VRDGRGRRGDGELGGGARSSWREGERGGRAGGGLRGKGKRLGLSLIWWGLAGEKDEEEGVLHVAVLALDGDK
jgi:hypothetical protein